MMLAYSLPLGYQRQKPVRRPKLGLWQAAIDTILEEDKSRPSKQRHIAKRIFERLRDEHSYRGGYTIVKDYVRQARIGSREMFVPLSHAPGEAQADFGEALAIIGGVECTAHYLVFDLPHSDDCFVVPFPAETTEAFLEGHVRAFTYLAGVLVSTLPSTIWGSTHSMAWKRLLGFRTICKNPQEPAIVEFSVGLWSIQNKNQMPHQHDPLAPNKRHS